MKMERRSTLHCVFLSWGWKKCWDCVFLQLLKSLAYLSSEKYFCSSLHLPSERKKLIINLLSDKKLSEVIQKHLDQDILVEYLSTNIQKVAFRAQITGHIKMPALMILHTKNAALSEALQTSPIFTYLLIARRTLSYLLSIHPEPMLLPARDNYCQLWQVFCEGGHLST